MALVRRRPFQGLLHHSDRGSQYASGDYQDVLAAAGIVCSMSRRGNCWDNAVAESFFATVKVELVHDAAWETRAAARSALFEYIEILSTASGAIRRSGISARGPSSGSARNKLGDHDGPIRARTRSPRRLRLPVPRWACGQRVVGCKRPVGCRHRRKVEVPQHADALSVSLPLGTSRSTRHESPHEQRRSLTRSERERS